MASKSLWVGINRTENAAIAAAEILGRKKSFRLTGEPLPKKLLTLTRRQNDTSCKNKETAEKYSGRDKP